MLTRPMTEAERTERAPQVQLLNAAKVKPEPIRWLWPGWLPLGKLIVLAGAPGTGKTTLAQAITAIVTIAGTWPDGTRCPVAGNVLFWSGEDDPADTLIPRLHAAGADLARVFFVGSVAKAGEHRPFDPSRDMDALAEAARRIGDVRMLVCDPIVSAVAGDSHKNAEVRRGLQPLVHLGHELGAAVFGVSHFTKGSQGRDPTERVTGSLAFGALARVVLAAAKVQDESSEHAGKRILARTKSNIGPDDGGFVYDLEQVELAHFPGVFATRVAWGTQLEGAARDLLREADTTREDDDEEADDTNEADTWLRDLLREEGGEVKKADVLRAAKACGMAQRTVERALSRIGGKSVTRGFGKDRHGVWSLPDHSRHHTRQPDEYGENGANGVNGERGHPSPPFSPISPFKNCSGDGGENDGEVREWLP